MFRLLKPEEIDCRVQTLKATGCSLLLYKDARCDMIILDETVGPMNWQRFHSRENANCIVQIWDNEKTQWISKEDTGTESYTEAAKGLASDSFKRACFNWGLGRELYTAPFVWIKLAKEEVSENNGKVYLKPGVKFFVKDIQYDDQRHIISLVIIDNKGNVRFTLGSKPPAKAPEPEDESQVPMIKETHLKALMNTAGKDKALLTAAIKACGYNSFVFPMEAFKDVMITLEKMVIEKREEKPDGK